MHFDHAGVVVDDAAAVTELYGALFDLPVAHEEEVRGMQMTFLDCGSGGYFELIEPLVDDTAVSGYLADHGPGVHHLALATDDIVGALEAAVEHGVRLVDEEPRPGAWGHDIAFLHPADTGGILLELVEH